MNNEDLNSASTGSNDDWSNVLSSSTPTKSQTLSPTAFDEGPVRLSRRGSKTSPEEGFRRRGVERRVLR